MFSLIKQVFIAVLRFRKSLAAKYVSLNNEPCMIRNTFIDLNPFELIIIHYDIIMTKSI